MRSLKDKERILLICKVYLDIKGPATAMQLCNYIRQCPVRILTDITPIKISSLVKGNKAIGRTRDSPALYYVKDEIGGS